MNGRRGSGCLPKALGHGSCGGTAPLHLKAPWETAEKGHYVDVYEAVPSCQLILASAVSLLPSSYVSGPRRVTPRLPRGSVILLFALARGERGSPAHEGSRRVGTPSMQRRSNSGQVDIRVLGAIALETCKILILFLLSEDASNLTGGTFATDGGWPHTKPPKIEETGSHASMFVFLICSSPGATYAEQSTLSWLNESATCGYRPATMRLPLHATGP